ARAAGDRRSEAQILYDVASLARRNGNLSEALTNIKAALAIVEILRTNIARQELRSSYFSTVRNYYELYIDVLMRLHKEQPSGGFAAAALQASERARARSLLELLNEARADIRQGVDPFLLQQARSLQQLLNRKAEHRARLLNGPHTAEQVTAATKEVEALTA